jgi:hypothetical protein
VDPKILASGIVAYRRARASELVLYPHVQMTLLELAKRGIRLGVVSDAPRFQVWLRLCSLGLQHLFDAVVTFDDTGERKPAAAPFRRCCAARGRARESLMIGDWAERDVVGAKGLGMTTVFARYGDTFDTKESGADHDVNDILEWWPSWTGSTAAAPREFPRIGRRTPCPTRRCAPHARACTDRPRAWPPTARCTCSCSTCSTRIPAGQVVREHRARRAVPAP